MYSVIPIRSITVRPYKHKMIMLIKNRSTFCLLCAIQAATLLLHLAVTLTHLQDQVTAEEILIDVITACDGTV